MKKSNIKLSEQTQRLVEYLHQGYILCKDHNGDPDSREFLISYSIGSYEVKGFCSALGNKEDRLLELITNPYDWKIIDFNHNEKDYPYPWSSLKNVKYNFLKNEK
mgnify:CR=1 FL=1